MKIAYIMTAGLLACGCSKPQQEKAAPTAPAPGTIGAAQPQPTSPATPPPATDTTPVTAPAPAAPPPTTEANMFTTPIKTLSGTPSSLAAFDGKALLLVNVASKCGLTPQYAQLEALQKQYAAKGFAVVGFPCNQFAGQEPGSAEEIAEFCSATYGVTFPMMEKVEVNGAGRHAIYQHLVGIKGADGYSGDIRWNFEKFVVSADRKTITRFDPRTKPDDAKVIAAIDAALPK